MSPTLPIRGRSFHCEWVSKIWDRNPKSGWADRRLCGFAPLREPFFSWSISMTENELAKVVVDVAYKIHQKLGPGLLESVYHAILVHELQKRGLEVKSRTPVPVMWDGLKLDLGFEADLIIENKLVVELKAVEEVARVHKRQLLTYLRLTDCRLGLLINFGAELIKDGTSRVANGLED
jgi:GxxExxY protein